MLLIKEGVKLEAVSVKGRVDIPFVKVLEPPSSHIHCDRGPCLSSRIAEISVDSRQTLMLLANTQSFISGHKLTAHPCLFQVRCQS